MKRQLFALVFTSFMIGSFFGIGAAAAQDLPTPTPDVIFITETPVSTEIVIIPPPVDTAVPTEEVTAEPTAPAPGPVENPVDATIILPYVGAMAAIAVIGMIVLGGMGLLLLFRSNPAVQFIGKTIAPPLGDAGVAAYEEYARNTPQPWDDEIAKQLRAEWENFKKKLLEDVKAQVATQVTAQVMPAVDKAMDAQIGIRG